MAATTPAPSPAAPLAPLPGRCWTPLRIRPRREKKAAEYARGKAVACYLPLLHRRRRYQRRNVEFLLPMFPGYLFCAVDEEQYRELLLSGHVAGRLVVDPPAELRLIAELNEIRQLETLAQERELLVMPELAAGKKVAVKSGPLRGLRGIVAYRKRTALVALNLDLLGQSVAAEVDVADLELDED